MKNLMAEKLRKIALNLDESFTFDESDSVYHFYSSNKVDWFYVRPCQNGWHIEFNNDLLNMPRAYFCVQTEEIFDLVDREDLIVSMREIVNRQLRMAHNRVEQLEKIKDQLV